MELAGAWFATNRATLFSCIFLLTCSEIFGAGVVVLLLHRQTARSTGRRDRRTADTVTATMVAVRVPGENYALLSSNI